MIYSIKYSLIRNFFSAALIIIYIFVSLIYQQGLFNNLISTNTITILLGFLIVVDFSLTEKNFLKLDKFEKINFLFISLFFFVLMNSIFIRQYLLFGALFNIIVCYVIAKKINNFKLNYWILLLPFWFLVFYILNKLLADPNPEMIFINSRNYVSFYLIITVLPYYLVSIINKKRYNLIPVIFLVSLSVYALGRSGIVASLLILIGLTYKKIKNGAYYTKFLFLIFILVIIYLIFVFFSNIEDFRELKRFSSANAFLSDGGRSGIIKLYLEKLDIASFLFGMNTEVELKSKLMSYGHLHSSFLNFYSVIGIGIIAFIYFFMDKIIFLRNNSHFDLILLFLAILIRVSTDVGMLFGFFDYAIWMFFLIDKNKIKKNKLH